MTICERIYYEMDRQRKRPGDLAKLLGVNTSVTSAWRTRNTDPPAKYIPQIASFLGVSIMYVLTGRESAERPFFSKDETLLIHEYRDLSDTSKELVSDLVHSAFLREQNRTSTTSSAV